MTFFLKKKEFSLTVYGFPGQQDIIIIIKYAVFDNHITIIFFTYIKE